MEPLTMALISGGLSAASGGLKAFGQNAAAKQKYADDLAFQEANNRFQPGRRGLNARVQDSNAQYKYWESTFNFNQQRAFANSQRNVELMKEAEQARVVFETRAAAGAAYMNDSAALSDGYMEAEMGAAVAQQQYTWRALQARASVQALNQEGNSVDRMVNNYASQLGDQMTLEAINKGIRERQYSRSQAAAVTQYLSRYNSQTFYNPTEVLDPDQAVPAVADDDLAAAAEPDRGATEPSSVPDQPWHRGIGWCCAGLLDLLSMKALQHRLRAAAREPLVASEVMAVPRCSLKSSRCSGT